MPTLETLNTKPPADCTNIDEIRAEIDALDQALVSLIGKRAQYVQQAARFKANPTEVKAPDRYQKMLLKRREWAEREGLNADMIAGLFEHMVTHFIQEEMSEWKSKK